MITFEAAFKALRAAEQLAGAHGWSIEPRFDTRNSELVILLRDGAHRPLYMLQIAAKTLDACETPDQLTELVEREVAVVLSTLQRVRRGAST